MKPRALDLFCGAGGATRGLQLAGFHVTGVDLRPQPRYVGDAFHQVDALTFPLNGYDFIWASPPCQRHSIMSNCRVGLAEKYADHIAGIRTRLQANGAPYVIENVPGSPLVNPILLCGAMFGLPLYRHRHFESSQSLATLPHPPHTTTCSKAGHYRPGTFVSVCGNCAPIAMSRAAMQIGWMRRDELSEAIPPAYSRYVGEQMMPAVLAGRRAIA